MDKYTFEMIPGLIGEIAELLRSINTKLDKLTAEPEPASAFPEWLNIKDLTAFMPTHPAAPTIYGWVRENLIPYYKRGKHLFSNGQRLRPGCPIGAIRQMKRLKGTRWSIVPNTR